jgi:hypothetical protein
MLYQILIFNMPHAKEELLIQTDGDIIYFQISEYEDVIYIFETNIQKDQVKINIYKKERSVWQLYREFFFEESDKFPLSFDGRNIFVQHQFVYFMNDLYYLDVSTNAYKKSQLFIEKDSDLKMLQASPIYCTHS